MEIVECEHLQYLVFQWNQLPVTEFAEAFGEQNGSILTMWSGLWAHHNIAKSWNGFGILVRFIQINSSLSKDKIVWKYYRYFIEI